MILTDKAIEDFQAWYISHIRQREYIGDRYFDHTLLDSFWRSGDIMTNAFVIEWLSYKDINIEIHKTWDELYVFKIYSRIAPILKQFYKTRQEATKQAIIKANEIYNEKHK